MNNRPAHITAVMRDRPGTYPCAHCGISVATAWDKFWNCYLPASRYWYVDGRVFCGVQHSVESDPHRPGTTVAPQQVT